MGEILVWLPRILFALFILRLLSRTFAARPAAPPRGRPSAPRERVLGTLVRDPQCGTYIPESRALTVGSGAGALHFCSASCRDAWAAAHGS